MTQKIFVFGSNLAGRHGLGAALVAHTEHGAVYGIGMGRTGNSYALPTKDEKLRILPFDTVRENVETFLTYANWHDDLMFNVTRIGCGLAGYNNATIAPLFQDAPENCLFDKKWRPWLGKNVEYWGTY